MATPTTYPTTNLGCYDPLTVIFSEVVTGGNPHPPALQIEVFINNISFRIIDIGTYKSRIYEAVSDTYVYEFEYDFAPTIKSFFDNNLFFYDPSKSYPFSDENLTAETYLKVSTYEPDDDGVLTLNPTKTPTAPRRFFNSLKRDFSDYTATSGRKFISTRQDNRLNKNFINLLAIFGDDDVNGVSVQNDAGTTFLNLVKNQINILKLNDYFDESTTFLTVSAGSLDGVDFTQNGEGIEYVFYSEPCDAFALHFQSELGNSEVFIFRNYEVELEQKFDRSLFVSTDNKVRAADASTDKMISLSRDGFFTKEFEFFRGVYSSSVFYVQDSQGNFEEAFPTFSKLPTKTPTGEIDVTLDLTFSDEQKIFEN